MEEQRIRGLLMVNMGEQLSEHSTLPELCRSQTATTEDRTNGGYLVSRDTLHVFFPISCRSTISALQVQ